MSSVILGKEQIVYCEVKDWVYIEPKVLQSPHKYKVIIIIVTLLNVIDLFTVTLYLQFLNNLLKTENVLSRKLLVHVIILYVYSFIHQWLYSPLLGPGLFFRFIIFFSFGATAPIWALTYLHETLRFTWVY